MFRYVVPYMMRHKVRLIFGFLFVTFSNLFGIVSPAIVKETIDYLQNEIVISKLFEYGGWILFFTIIFC